MFCSGPPQQCTAHCAQVNGHARGPTTAGSTKLSVPRPADPYRPKVHAMGSGHRGKTPQRCQSLHSMWGKQPRGAADRVAPRRTAKVWIRKIASRNCIATSFTPPLMRLFCSAMTFEKKKTVLLCSALRCLTLLSALKQRKSGGTLTSYDEAKKKMWDSPTPILDEAKTWDSPPSCPHTLAPHHRVVQCATQKAVSCQ